MSVFRETPALFERFRQGERDALERVYWVYVAQVEKILRFGCSRGDGARPSGAPASELEDMVQEVFIRAFGAQARRAYDGQRPYAPYLFTIARNVLTDWLRRAGREVPTEGPALETALQAPPPPDDHADPRTVMAVERFVARLPPDLRGVHEQRFARGLSQREAAAALGISRQNLRTLEQRLRDALRAELIALGELSDGDAAVRSAASGLGKDLGPDSAEQPTAWAFRTGEGGSRHGPL
jgi:RNA polymerase sigma factor (sigma-70 family)